MAAGRPSTAGRNHNSPPASRMQYNGSFSDEGGDSDNNRGYPTRKPSGSLVEEETDDDDAGYDHSGDSDVDLVGSDLYRDEGDRQKLAEMTELEREFILSDRAMKRYMKELLEKLKRSKPNDKKPQPRREKESRLPRSSRPTSSRRVRSYARSADRSAAKDDALNELRAKRMKHQDPEAHWKLRDATRRGSGKRGAFAAASLNSESESWPRSEDEESTGDAGMTFSDEENISGAPTF